METARLARTLGTLLRNGVPLITALGIGRSVIGNRVLAADVEAAAEDVKNGLGLSTALGRASASRGWRCRWVQVGEESGALDAMLLKIADFRTRDRPGAGPDAAALVRGDPGAGGGGVMVVIVAVLVRSMI